MKSTRIYKLGLIFLAGILMLSIITGCSTTKTVTGTQRDEILTYADPATDSILQGMNNSDYATFSKDFDDTMKKSLSEQQFPGLEQTVIGKVGKYVSRKIDSVVDLEKYYQVNYNAKFEQDEPVLVRVVFTKDTHQVSGLFFDSAKLRQK